VPLFRRSPRPAPTEEDHRLLRSALGKLDPWSFWSVRLDDDDVDYAVLGTTGAFAVAIVGLDGFAEPSGDGLRIGPTELTGFREVLRGARRLHGRLLEASAFHDVEPVLCLTRATAGSSRTIRGTRVVRLEDLPDEIAGRPRSFDPSTARRAAEALGRVLRSASGPRPDVEG
jgi:hypothetical protein